MGKSPSEKNAFESNEGPGNFDLGIVQSEAAPELTSAPESEAL
jgi:hypothetical protein